MISLLLVFLKIPFITIGQNMWKWIDILEKIENGTVCVTTFQSNDKQLMFCLKVYTSKL